MLTGTESKTVTNKLSSTDEADRAAGSIVGAFIGDALGLGPHWYYDLDEQRRDFGDWIDGYRDPKPEARYHRGMKAGELSQTGIIMLLLLRSLAERGTYDEADFTRRLDEELLPKLNGEAFAGPGGYTNHSFREVWRARVREGKPWGETGSDADTTEAAERLALIGARFASDPAAATKQALSCCRLSQTDSLVAQQSVAFACVIGALVRGEAFDEELSDKLMALVDEGDVDFVAEKSADPAHSLGFASPDALLLPSWIAKVANDPQTRIEPAWRVSEVYGMSCAINFVLPGAYYLAARYPDDFESAVLHAINGGGQNMSRACLAGVLVGAQVGLSGIPERFVKGLKEGEEIVKLARKVAAAGC
jgi:ADP-ribosylglycohydrolase